MSVMDMDFEHCRECGAPVELFGTPFMNSRHDKTEIVTKQLAICTRCGHTQ